MNEDRKLIYITVGILFALAVLIAVAVTMLLRDDAKKDACRKRGGVVRTGECTTSVICHTVNKTTTVCNPVRSCEWYCEEKKIP